MQHLCVSHNSVFSISGPYLLIYVFSLIPFHLFTIQPISPTFLPHPSLSLSFGLQSRLPISSSCSIHFHFRIPHKENSPPPPTHTHHITCSSFLTLHLMSTFSYLHLIIFHPFPIFSSSYPTIGTLPSLPSLPSLITRLMSHFLPFLCIFNVTLLSPTTFM